MYKEIYKKCPDIDHTEISLRGQFKLEPHPHWCRLGVWGKFEWSPLWILPNFSAILPFGFSVTTDPPFVLPKLEWSPLKSSTPPPHPRAINYARSLNLNCPTRIPVTFIWDRVPPRVEPMVCRLIVHVLPRCIVFPHRKPISSKRKKYGRVLRRYADIPVSTGYLMVPKKLEKVKELISCGGLLCSCIRDTQLQDI